MSTEGMTPRLLARVGHDFPTQYDEAIELLGFTESGNQNRERVLAAVVLIAKGRLLSLRYAVQASQRDWRDVLVESELANVGWPQVLDHLLGTD